MSYSLEHESEAERLERQSGQPAYNLDEELAAFSARPGERVLDAGCGTGLLSRYLAERFEGLLIDACDFSKIRVEQAGRLGEGYENIHFFEGDVCALPVENDVYDAVINRYVLEHLKNPQDALAEFYRVLKPGGRAYIIDVDGIVFNFYDGDNELLSTLARLEQAFDFDLFIGRKIPHMMKQAGFSRIEWRAALTQFHGEDRKEEIENFIDRFQFARPLLEQVLGKEEARDFAEAYVKALHKEEAVFFYNKFVVQGVKQTPAKTNK